MRPVLCLIAVLLGGCDFSGAADGTARDPGGGTGLGWEVTEVVRVGTVTGPEEYAFNRVWDLASDGEGHVYVLDQGDRVVRRYDPGGEYVSTFGGEGDGPGEFNLPMGLAVSGDSVVVYDAAHQRVTFFDGEGTVLGTLSVDLNPADGFAQRMISAGPGWALELRTGCRFPPPEDPRPRWRVAYVDGAGEVRMIMDEATPDWLAVYTEQGCTNLPALARPVSSLAFDAQGYLYRGDGQEYEVEVLDFESFLGDPSTAPVRMVGRDAGAAPVTSEQIQNYEEERLGEEPLASDPARISVVEALWDSVGYPERWPYFEGFHVDRGGFLWVERPVAGGGGVREWDVFDPHGAYLGTTAISAEVDVVEIAGSMIWGIVQDAFDVDYVVGLQVRGWPN